MIALYAALWRMNWRLMLVLLLDAAAWVGLVLLASNASAAEAPKPGAVCDLDGTRAVVQFLEPGKGEPVPWAWVTLDVQGGWYWHRVRVDALRGCK